MAVDVGAEGKPAGRWISAQDIARTLICGRHGCDREIDAGSDAGDWCLPCKLRFRDQPGTALPGQRRTEGAPAQGAAVKTATTDAAAGPPFTCQTPGCGEEAKAGWGRYSFCVPCQVRRGTRNSDGTLVTARTRRRDARRPRSVRAPAPATTATPEARGTEKRRDPQPVSDRAAGGNERAVLELLDLARRVDLALAGLEAARVEAETAQAEWRDALAGLPTLTVEKGLRERLIERPG